VGLLEFWRLKAWKSWISKNIESVYPTGAKLCFMFRSPYIPLAAFDCFAFEGLSEKPSVFLVSRLFA